MMFGVFTGEETVANAVSRRAEPTVHHMHHTAIYYTCLGRSRRVELGRFFATERRSREHT